VLERKLKEATRDTKSKGEYQKIQHASKLLEKLDVDKVRKASSECDRIFTTLTKLMEQGN
jgi:restriction endonuclease